MTAPLETSAGCFDAIRRVVGDNRLRVAAPEDAVDGVVPRWVVEPASSADLAQVLSLANSAKLKVIPRGNGTKLDWGNPPGAADIALSTTRLNRVLEHAAGDMTATVQAGCTVAAFAKVLAERGQRLALDPLWPRQATVGGILATNDNGALRAAYGTLRDHLIGITVALADGTIAKSGGKVVKNVAGYDLPKLFTGSFGTLGVITEAIFRLYPCAHSTQTLRFVASSQEVLFAVISALTECSLATSAVQIETGHDEAASILILIEGLPQAIGGKVQRVTKIALDGGATPAEPTADAWTARERLFADPNSCVAKASLLPTQWPGFVDRVRDVATRREMNWQIIAQAVGVGLLRLQSPQSAHIADSLLALRSHLNSQSGSLTLLRCPPGVKGRIDVWPDVGNALPLMRRIKEQFDPNRTLSAGRFVGGI